MRTIKARRFDEQNEKEIEKAVSKFSYQLLSNAKWIKLVEILVENINSITEIQFKKVLNNRIGELYLQKDTTFGFDYWEHGFEGMNSLKGWMLFKEIEYLKFPMNGKQNVIKIKNFIESIGEFEFLENEMELILLCYK